MKNTKIFVILLTVFLTGSLIACGGAPEGGEGGGTEINSGSDAGGEGTEAGTGTNGVSEGGGAVTNGGSGGSAGSSESVDLPSIDPENPNRIPGLEIETDSAKQLELIKKIWTILTGPLCWDASAVVGGAQPTGITDIWKFGGFLDLDNIGSIATGDYRHVGFNVNLGRLLWFYVGHYKGNLTAIVRSWAGVPEAFVIINNTTIGYVRIDTIEGNTRQIVLQYGASNSPGCNL